MERAMRRPTAPHELLPWAMSVMVPQADQPMPEAVLELSLPAKTQHYQTLKVTNWLHKPQRFR